MKILIAEDHAIVRRGLKELLAEEFREVLFGEAQSEREALEALGQQKWDVLVLDISLGGRSGLEVLRELKARRVKVPVVVYTMHPEEQFAIRALRLGAAAYVTKERTPEELCHAIRKVLEGGKYINTSLAEKLADALAAPLRRHESLSDREYLVFRLLASGKTVGNVARELTLSVKTISTYRTRILTKLGMKTNAELIRYAIENRLVE